jgi:hypothetical protein
VPGGRLGGGVGAAPVSVRRTAPPCCRASEAVAASARVPDVRRPKASRAAPMAGCAASRPSAVPSACHIGPTSEVTISGWSIRRGRVSCRRNTITSWRSTSSSMSLAAPRACRTISPSSRRGIRYTTETTTAGDLPLHPGRNPPERPGHSQHQHSEARHGSSVEPAKSGSPLGDSG